MSAVLIACEKTGSETVFDAADPDRTPPPQADVVLAQLDELFIGEYGCQSFPEASILNFDSNADVQLSDCVENTTSEGVNPAVLFDSNRSAHAFLDTRYDPLREDDYLVFADAGALFLIDIQNNESRRLTSFIGEVCRVLPAQTFYKEPGSGAVDERWYEIDDAFVYAEVVVDEGTGINCDSAAAFRRYFKVSVNYDSLADDAEVCSSEADGKSTAADCKTRLLPVVSAAEARSQLVKGYALDETTTADLTDRVLTFGYLGWGADENELVLFDENRDEIWAQERNLEAFPLIENLPGTPAEELVELSELDDNFYLFQLNRDVFVFAGETLFDASDASTVLSDRQYLIEAQTNTEGATTSPLQFAFDDDDLLIFDNGKFFFLDYKAGAVTPTLSSNIEIVESRSLLETLDVPDEFEYSQFNVQACEFSADETACDDANDVGGAAWSVTSACTAGVGCSFPVDTTDYCVTDAESTGSTPQEDRCTPSKFEDLNELDDPANNVEFKSFLPYFADNMRDLDFQIYNNEALLNMRLTERDALVLYDYNQSLVVPKGDREQVLLGDRLVQSISRPIVQNGGLYINTFVQSSFVGNVCFKEFNEVQCNLAKVEAGASDECTSVDLAAGECRVGRYNFESRALFCTDAQVIAGTCTDDQQINSLSRQIESSTQDAKWIPSRLIDSAGAITRTMHVLVTEDQQASTNNPLLGYTRYEGILGNPDLYQVDELNPINILSASLVAALQGEVESIPEIAIFRETEGRLGLNQEEFVSGQAFRHERRYYLNSQTNQLFDVTGRQLPH